MSSHFFASDFFGTDSHDLRRTNMRFRLRTVIVAISCACCALAAFRCDEIYFRLKYGPRVPARQIRTSAINDMSLRLIIRGEPFRTDKSRTYFDWVSWSTLGQKKGREPDLRILGVWETPYVDRPYVIKVGRETLFARPCQDVLEQLSPEPDPVVATPAVPKEEQESRPSDWSKRTRSYFPSPIRDK